MNHQDWAQLAQMVLAAVLSFFAGHQTGKKSGEK